MMTKNTKKAVLKGQENQSTGLADIAFQGQPKRLGEELTRMTKSGTPVADQGDLGCQRAIGRCDLGSELAADLMNQCPANVQISGTGQCFSPALPGRARVILKLGKGRRAARARGQQKGAFRPHLVFCLLVEPAAVYDLKLSFNLVRGS